MFYTWGGSELLDIDDEKKIQELASKTRTSSIWSFVSVPLMLANFYFRENPSEFSIFLAVVFVPLAIINTVVLHIDFRHYQALIVTGRALKAGRASVPAEK